MFTLYLFGSNQDEPLYAKRGLGGNEALKLAFYWGIDSSIGMSIVDDKTGIPVYER